jgi:hypothetical protein
MRLKDAWVHKLRRLGPDWNSYGSPPISEAAIQSVRSLTNIIPASEGGVQMEWHTNGYDIELVFAKDGSGIEAVSISHDRHADRGDIQE